MNITELQKRAHETAVQKGWHINDELDANGKPTARQMLAWLALVTDELDEAACETELEYYEPDGKPCGILSEYADALIRIMDWAGACGFAIIEVLFPLELKDGIQKARTSLTEAIRGGKEAGTDLNLSFLFGAIGHECIEKAGVTVDALWRMVETKMAYNETRSFRHGNKLA